MASPNVSFGQIPGSIRKPGHYFEFNTKLANSGVAVNEQKMCIVAPMLATGTQTEKTPVQVFDSEQTAVLFGRGSIIHRMTKSAFEHNGNLSLTLVGVKDAVGATKATGTMTIAGTATAFGLLTAYVGRDRFELGISTGDTATSIAGKLKTALEEKPDLPVTLSVSAGVVTLTAKNAGTIGNFITTSVNSAIPGVTATAVALASGATDPDLDSSLDSIFPEHFHIVATAWNSSTMLGILKQAMVDVSAPLEERRGHGVFAIVNDTIANNTTLTTGLNSERLTGVVVRGVKMPHYELASAYGAIISGENDPVLPLNGLEVRGVDIPAIKDRYSRQEQESLLAGGVTPLEVRGGEIVRIVRSVTTYTKNSSGSPDQTLTDLGIQRGLDYYALAQKRNLESVFGRAKLSSKTPDRVKDQLFKVAKQLEALEILTSVDDFKDRFIVEKDSSDFTRLNCRVPAPLVVGFHISANVVDLYL
jgi:phage tail sheath gpL-like